MSKHVIGASKTMRVKLRNLTKIKEVVSLESVENLWSQIAALNLRSQIEISSSGRHSEGTRNYF